MNSITRACAAAVVAVAAFATPSEAGDAPSTAPFLEFTPSGGTIAGACNFLFSGPSLDPSTNPYWIEGSATYAGIEPAASTELSCMLRTASNDAEVGRRTRNLPGYASAIFDNIPVRSFGPFELCTMVNIHYVNGNESNPLERFACRPLTRI